MPAAPRSSSKPADNILSRREQAPPSTTPQSELPQSSSTAVTYQKRPSDQSDESPLQPPPTKRVRATNASSNASRLETHDTATNSANAPSRPPTPILSLFDTPLANELPKASNTPSILSLPAPSAGASLVSQTATTSVSDSIIFSPPPSSQPHPPNAETSATNNLSNLPTPPPPQSLAPSQPRRPKTLAEWLSGPIRSEKTAPKHRHNPISRSASSKSAAPSTHNSDSQPSVGSNRDHPISLLSDTPSPPSSPSKPAPSGHPASTAQPAATIAPPPSSSPSNPLAAPPTTRPTERQSSSQADPVRPHPSVPSGSTASSSFHPPAVPNPPAARSPSLPLTPTRPPSRSPSPEPSDGPSTPQKKQRRKKKGKKTSTDDEPATPKPKRARSPRQREKRKVYQKRAKNDARMPPLEGIPRPAPPSAPLPVPHTHETSPHAVPRPISQPIDGERSASLRNPRNDCYSLGYLQSMFCIRSHVNHIHDADCNPEGLPHALQSVLQEMADNPDGVVDAAGFRRACERVGCEFGRQRDIIEFVDEISPHLKSTLAPSVVLHSDAVCSICSCPFVHGACMPYIPLELKQKKKKDVDGEVCNAEDDEDDEDGEEDKEVALQSLVDKWANSQSKGLVFSDQERCRHDTGIQPSLIESMSDHLLLYIPRPKHEEGGEMNHKSVAINKTLHVDIPSQGTEWTGYPVAIVSVHGTDQAAHYTATVLEGNQWVLKDDHVSTPLPPSFDPLLPRFVHPQNSIPRTATFLVYRKLDGLPHSPNDFIFSTNHPIIHDLESLQDTSDHEFSDKADQIDYALSDDEIDDDENDYSDDYLDDDDGGPGPQPTSSVIPPRGAKYEHSTAPRNVRRRALRMITQPPKKAEHSREIYALHDELNERDQAIHKEYLALLNETKDYEPVRRLKCLLDWACLRKGRLRKPVLGALEEAVKHEPTCEALHAWADDPVLFKGSLRPAALKGVNGDRTVSRGEHKFYYRGWKCTREEAMDMFQRYRKKYPADAHFANVWLERLGPLEPGTVVRIPYIGETTLGSVQQRQDDDAASGTLHTRLGNFLPFLGDREPELFEWVGLTRDISDESAGTQTQRRRIFQIYEQVIILLGGDFTLNSSDGGPPAPRFDLDAMSPQLLAAEAEMHKRFPFRSPHVTDPDLSPELAQLRQRLEIIHAVELAVHANRGVKEPAESAKQASLAGLIGVGFNRHGRVIEVGVCKDRTEEELKGESTFTGPHAGPAPSLWREHSTRARQLSLRSTPLASFEELVTEFAENSWAYTNVFPITKPHDFFHREFLSLILKLRAILPLITRLWGAAVTEIFECGILQPIDMPGIAKLERECTPENFEDVVDKLPDTDWFGRFIAKSPWSSYASPAKFLKKVGTMFLAELIEGVFTVALIYPHYGGPTKDPLTSNLLQELAYLVELKHTRLYAAASELSWPSKQELLKLVKDVDADCTVINAGIEYLKSQLDDDCSPVQSVRMLSSWSRRAQQAEEQGTAAEFKYESLLGVSRATQVGNEDAVKAPHEAKSDARKAWASEVIASRDEALECCRPDPLPNPFETSAELFDHLVRMKKGTNIIRSLDGIRGNQALRARNATEEGQALRLEQNKNHSRTMRLKHQTEIERLQAEYDAADEDARTDEKFLCLRWDNIFTTSKAVELLARPNFEDAKPSDSALSLAQCTSCGDVCIVSRNTKHRCPSASNPKKTISIPDMKKAGTLKLMTVLTPHELLSHPLCRPLPANFFEQTGLVQESSINALPLGVVIPPMSPDCQAAWDASFVIYHPDDPTESARFQAHDTLARLVLGLDRDQDVIFENVYDSGLPLGLIDVLGGGIPHACIAQVDCAQCPRTLVTVSQPSRKRRNDIDYNPKESRLVHSPRRWFPDTMSLLPADPGRLQRVGDSLRAHGDADRVHSGTIGENYPDFWHLPLMIKRAHIYACFFHNTKLGKAKGGDSLLGNAVTVVNWQSPS